MNINKQPFILIKKDSENHKSHLNMRTPSFEVQNTSIKRISYPDEYFKESLIKGKSFDISSDIKRLKYITKDFLNLESFIRAEYSLLCIPSFFNYNGYSFHLLIGDKINIRKQNINETQYFRRFRCHELDIGTSELCFDNILNEISYQIATVSEGFSIWEAIKKDLNTSVLQNAINLDKETLINFYNQLKYEHNDFVSFSHFSFGYNVHITKDSDFFFDNSDTFKVYSKKNGLFLI